MTLHHEQHFIEAAESLEPSPHDISAVIDLLHEWHKNLRNTLTDHPLTTQGLQEDSILAAHVRAINAGLQTSMQEWAQHWKDLEPTQALANTFTTRIMLLVFGKFNAGKSSFCNFLADRFAMHGLPTSYFRVSNGRIIDVADPFEEGTTETTAQLQGINLGKGLVLLDTPGLHSVTPENATLTQRFTDSADGVLWLTSSTSPGQVQELDELARELHRNKPLLPVITRSDTLDEDEVNGEIQKILLNKTPENRSEQENDVQQRATEKLVAMQQDPSLLKPPVSVSTHAARHDGQTAPAIADAGFERLYAALLDMVEPTLQYKQRKPAEILLHHLEERVVHSLYTTTLPRLDQLHKALEAEQALLEHKKGQIIRTVWRDVIPALPELLEHHTTTHDFAAITQAVTRQLHDSAAQALRQELSDYDVSPDFSVLDITLDHPDNNVSHDELHTTLQTTIRTALEQWLDATLEQCHAAIEQLASERQHLQDIMDVHIQRLEHIKSTNVR